VRKCYYVVILVGELEVMGNDWGRLIGEGERNCPPCLQEECAEREGVSQVIEKSAGKPLPFRIVKIIVIYVGSNHWDVHLVFY
jgi:hypothetical protein